MNSAPEENFLRRAATARHDLPPALDLAALLRQLPPVVSSSAPSSFLETFGQLFASPRALSATAAAALLLCAAAAWQAWDASDEIEPWAALATLTSDDAT